MSGVMNINYLLCHPTLYESPDIMDMDISTNNMFQLYKDIDVWDDTLSITNSTSQGSLDSYNGDSVTSSSSPKTPHQRHRMDDHFYRPLAHKSVSPQLIHSKSVPLMYVQTRTPWSPMEDDLLKQGYEQGLSWAMISSTFLPHRSRGCCWGRFKTLQNKNVVEVYQKKFSRKPWKVTIYQK
ncbi:hypothetical protein BDB01DRAFT_443462 [Pilobolus umbonatus]|nr:hypothetical protein BDB01DRAFT_443462 [Pilobolus umbonatus]